tara:strand:- start:631 stop:1053 length:423 start_codon:yes stop_codon:yes gene_type:complete
LTKIEATGTVVYGISGDSQESHYEFQEQYRFGFPLLSDNDLVVSRLYSSISADKQKSSRTTFVIDRAGYVRSINNNVNIPQHGTEVLETIQSMTSYEINVGHIAPDFVAYDENGKGYRLRDFRNKRNVVLSFYPMDMTPG